jgi:hypothetical protein
MELNKIGDNKQGWSMRTVLQHISKWLKENATDNAKMRK